MAIKNIDLFFDENPNPMWIYDRDSLQILEVNESALSLYGYSREEMLSKTIKDLRPQEEIPKLLESQKHKIKSFDDAGIWKHKTKDGEIIHVRIMAHPVEVEGVESELILANNVTEQIKVEEQYKESQYILETIVNKLPGTFFIIDNEGNLIRWNNYVEEFLHYSSDELSSMHAMDFFEPEQHPKIEAAIQEVLQEGSIEIKDNIKGKYGSLTPILIKASSVKIQGKDRIIGVGIDISKLTEVQDRLRIANAKLKAAQSIAKVGYWTHDIAEDESEWSEEVYDIWEVDPESFTPNFNNILETVHPDDRHLLLNDIEESFPTDDYFDSEHRIITPNGEVKWILERITLHRDEEGRPTMLEGIAQDITDQKEQQKEKEVLVSEIHHRVKNNLAVISGLMELEAMESDSNELQEKLMDSQYRINSIALTHEILYKQESFSQVNYEENLKGLIDQILETFGNGVEVIYDLEPVILNINQALPCSLIVNEIVTNALKHAFEGGDDAIIEVQLQEKDGEIYLSISDNGKGMPDNCDINNPDNLGLQLIKILKKQLEASLSIKSDNGATIKLIFEKSEKKGIGSTILEDSLSI